MIVPLFCFQQPTFASQLPVEKPLGAAYVTCYPQSGKAITGLNINLSCYHTYPMNYEGLQKNWLIDSWRVSIAHGPLSS